MVKGAYPFVLTFDIDGLYGNEVTQTEKILQLLQERRAFATFFITAVHAQKHPELVDLILNEGHEIACHGYDHTTITRFTPPTFMEWMKQATDKLQNVARKRILGFRAPNFVIPKWIPLILNRLGYKYDSSVQPSLPVVGWYGAPRAPLYPYCPSPQNIYVHSPIDYDFAEFPLAVSPRLRIPSGGWWIRNLGAVWAKKAVNELLKKGAATLYFHPWEFQEKMFLTGIEGLNIVNRALWFRRVGQRMYNVLEDILEDVRAEKVSIEMAIKHNSIVRRQENDLTGVCV